MDRKEENIWNRFSHFYDFIMRKDYDAYQKINHQIQLTLKPETYVLEVATGTGNVALELSNYINKIEAVDFSKNMIEKAKKKAEKMHIKNVYFSVQDACDLQYKEKHFDCVIIANALHIMPRPDRVLNEIKRVLKKNGKLIAPTFIHKSSKKNELISKLMEITGFYAYHKWTMESYQKFLKENNFIVKDYKLFDASFPLVYVEAKIKN